MGHQIHGACVTSSMGSHSQSPVRPLVMPSTETAPHFSMLPNLGEDHPSVATSRSNLAGVLQDLGELPGARELLEQALASALVNLGDDHPLIATYRFNLALVQKALGDLPAARGLLEQALVSEVQSLGENHPSLALTVANLALVLKDLGELEDSKEKIGQALRTVAGQPEGSYYKVNVERIATQILTLEDEE